MVSEILTVGISDELITELTRILTARDFRFTVSLTIRDASRLLTQQTFHLLIVDLSYLQNMDRTNWLSDIRRISVVPILVLSDIPEQDTNHMIQLGADICVSTSLPYIMMASLMYAQIRRYTAYNHYCNQTNTEAMSFRVGDIFIDPARRIVKVGDKPVELRPREFSLLLYFMRNPGIVLTAEQICEYAWDAAGYYNRGIAQPIRLLRLAIEPDPRNPVYIKTIRQVGYCLKPYNVKTCDKC